MQNLEKFTYVNLAPGLVFIRMPPSEIKKSTLRRLTLVQPSLVSPTAYATWHRPYFGVSGQTEECQPMSLIYLTLLVVYIFFSKHMQTYYGQLLFVYIQLLRC